MDEPTSKREQGNTTPSPELSALLTELLGSRAAEGETSTSAEEVPAQAHASPLPTGGDGLGAALADPRLMAALPTVLSLLRSAPPPTPTSQKGGGSRAECRDKLLIALKPFLSPGRCAAVDTLLRISSLGSILKKLT